MKTAVKKFSIVITATLMAVGVAAPIANTNSKAPNNQTVLAAKRHHRRHHRHHKKHYIRVYYTIRNFKKRIGHKRLRVRRGTSVLGALKKGWKVRYEHGKYGAFVTSIKGYRQNTRHNIYWTYKVNGKTANKACSAWKLHNKDHVTWTRGH